MNTRKFAMGCGITALVVIVLLIIGAVVTFMHLKAPVPLPEAAPLLDTATLGFAMVRLEPDNPWMVGALQSLNRHSMRDSDPNKVLPLELMWQAQRNTPEAERQTLLFSLSPSGRILGLSFDFTLWKIGRSGESGAQRVEYGDEGITSFPKQNFKGSVFVRGNMVVWASDLEAAERMVDRLRGAPAQTAETGSQPEAATAEGGPAPIYGLLPDPTKHMLTGAVINENGALLRSLRTLSHKADDLPPEAMARIASASLVLDVGSASEAAGSLTLQFAPGVTPADAQQIAELIAARITDMHYADITVQVTPKAEPGRTTLDIHVAGLDSMHKHLLEDLGGLEDSLREMQKSGIPPVEKGGPSVAPPSKPEVPPKP